MPYNIVGQMLIPPSQSSHVIIIKPPARLHFCQRHCDFYVRRCLICAFERRQAHYERHPRLKRPKRINRKLQRTRWRFQEFKKRLAEGSCNYDDWVKRLVEYEYRCAYCGKPLEGDDETIDHAVPISRGGTNDIENLVPCCRSCNSKKHDKTADEYKALIQVGGH